MNATALLSGQVGAAATTGAYGTAGGHLGRLHGSVTAGVVAGAAAHAGGKLGLENGFLKHSADINAAVGVGTHLKTDAALDLRHHIKPGIASGLRPSLATMSGVASSAGVVEPAWGWRHSPLASRPSPRRSRRSCRRGVGAPAGSWAPWVRAGAGSWPRA